MKLELWLIFTLIILSPFCLWLGYYWAGLILKVANREINDEKK